jgi:hypothetical protein
MNFNNYYNKILEQYNTKDIPFDNYVSQIWVYSSGDYNFRLQATKDKNSLFHYTINEKDFEWVIHRWKDYYPVEDLGDTNIEYVGKDAQQIRKILDQHFNDRHHFGGVVELYQALDELENRVNPNIIGYYKFFGNTEALDYWLCYVYIIPDKLSKIGILKDMTQDETDDINDW